MHRENSGFTLIELLVVIAIIAILAAILFPVFTTAKTHAQQSSCASNQHQLGMAIMQYAQDNNDRLPFWKKPDAPGSTNYPINTWWTYVVQPYTKNYKVFYCPSRGRENTGTYDCLSDFGYNVHYLVLNDSTVNARGILISQAAQTAKTVLICDVAVNDLGKETLEVAQQIHVNVPSRKPDNLWVVRPAFRHNGSVNVTWLDGHTNSQRKGAPFYPSYKAGPAWVSKLDAYWDLK